MVVARRYAQLTWPEPHPELAPYLTIFVVLFQLKPPKLVCFALVSSQSSLDTDVRYSIFPLWPFLLFPLTKLVPNTDTTE